MLKRLSHFGVIVRNIEEAKRWWTETFGLKVSHSGVAEVEGIKFAFLPIGDNFIELIEPIDQRDMSNAVAKRLAIAGEGIFQVVLEVDDILQEGKELREKGVRIIKRPAIEGNPHGRWIVHPKSANGVLLELVTQGPRL